MSQKLFEFIDEIENIIIDAEEGYFSIQDLKDVVSKYKLSLKSDVE